MTPLRGQCQPFDLGLSLRDSLIATAPRKGRGKPGAPGAREGRPGKGPGYGPPGFVLRTYADGRGASHAAGAAGDADRAVGQPEVHVSGRDEFETRGPGRELGPRGGNLEPALIDPIGIPYAACFKVPALDRPTNFEEILVN